MTFVKKLPLLCSAFLILIFSASCGKVQGADWHSENHTISKALTYDHSMELKYAEEYAVDYYSDGFVLISIADGSRFLVNTRGKSIPEDLDKTIVVLNAPVQNIYLAASAVFDMFHAIDATDTIALSGIKEESWYIEAARQAMQTGQIEYAGKYNEPDYEKIVVQHCELAVESTMILHSPKVRENLEGFGIPVLVDYSSYEKHPLGRTEWVRLYGVLTGREKEAEEAFLAQEKKYEQAGEMEATGKTVVFFYITNNQTAVVRKPNDYVAKMIELAGGTYLFQNLNTEDNAASSVNMQLEEFYAKAWDADFLVYNSTIDGELATMADLLARCKHLKDFKAVKEGNVWCATSNVYQYSMHAGDMIAAFHTMLTAEGEENESSDYFFRLQ